MPTGRYLNPGTFLRDVRLALAAHLRQRVIGEGLAGRYDVLEHAPWGEIGQARYAQLIVQSPPSKTTVWIGDVRETFPPPVEEFGKGRHPYSEGGRQYWNYEHSASVVASIVAMIGEGTTGLGDPAPLKAVDEWRDFVGMLYNRPSVDVPPEAFSVTLSDAETCVGVTLPCLGFRSIVAQHEPLSAAEIEGARETYLAVVELQMRVTKAESIEIT